jgi:hypothetical protein
MTTFATLDHFRPADDDRFVWCCGGYRRWEIVWKGDRPYWQLASDWGQATVAGLVTPRGAFRLSVEVDLSELPQGTLALTLCSRLRLGTPGIDGLPFFAVATTGVVLSHATIEVRPTGRPTAQAPAPNALRDRACTLVLVSHGAELAVHVDGTRIADGFEAPTTPCFVLLSGNTGADDPRGRFGEIGLEAPARRRTSPGGDA